MGTIKNMLYCIIICIIKERIWIMELRITTLIEDEQDQEKQLLFEHGFSLYIEFEGKNILFDTGQTGAFVKNAVRLQKNLKDLNYVIVSHGHYDHGGGIRQEHNNTL